MSVSSMLGRIRNTKRCWQSNVSAYLRQQETVSGEYVSGGDKTTGGIQRFKLSEHEAGLPVAVMVGYIQRETTQIWLEKINGWLVEMAGSKTGDGLLWERDEKSGDFRYDSEAATACAISSHPRVSGTPRLHEQPIEIRHLWVEMSRRRAIPIS